MSFTFGCVGFFGLIAQSNGLHRTRNFTIQPHDYIFARVLDPPNMCLAWPRATAPSEDGVDWQFGTPFLRTVYSIFRWVFFLFSVDSRYDRLAATVSTRKNPPRSGCIRYRQTLLSIRKRLFLRVCRSRARLLQPPCPTIYYPPQHIPRHPIYFLLLPLLLCQVRLRSVLVAPQRPLHPHSNILSLHWANPLRRDWAQAPILRFLRAPHLSQVHTHL